jgi:hypothetical protein
MNQSKATINMYFLNVKVLNIKGLLVRLARLANRQTCWQGVVFLVFFVMLLVMAVKDLPGYAA